MTNIARDQESAVVALIGSAGRDMLAWIFAAATVAGLANVLILALIHITMDRSGALDVSLFLGLVAASVMYVFGARYTHSRITGLFETALYDIKLRIIGKIEHADLARLERLGNATIRDRLIENAALVSGAAEAVGAFMQCVCVMIAVSLYIAWLCWPAFLMLVLCCLGLRAWYRSRDGLLRRSLRQLAAHRIDFFGLLSDLLRGFKEVKLNQARDQELAMDIERLSDSLGRTNHRFFHVFNDNWIALESWRCVLIGAVVFMLPLHLTMGSMMLYKLVTALLFFFSPISANILNIPSYVRVSEALLQIRELEASLDAVRGQPDSASAAWNAGVPTIELQALEYSYPAQSEEAGFHIGPINLTVKPGEVLFIVGGNGSGKSTLLKLLTGLYLPSAGVVRANGVTVGLDHITHYRELFSAIFSDFHLFARPYGLPNVEPDLVDALTRELHLHGKVEVTAEGNLERNLSTGQRKRLAMLLALLEDRPVYVFDEWAADQDPSFRRYFYEDVLPRLRMRGKAVIVVSHDDQYFHHADQLHFMEYGLLRQS
ncbi:MAG: ATP-binding cassette domain-containing protein [Myxococcales bacterium]|nr:ATP-binding cassette domain-containing protein [Myxococcales bacterium]